MGIYPREPYVIGQDTAVLQPGRLMDKLVKVKPAQPGNVILIHGVNDVGVSYDQVETGLCAGLGDRLASSGVFQPASYRMPREDDKGKLEEDPDAVFFKRELKEGHHTPVIPFYWGYRPSKGNYRPGELTPHGQAVDVYGNRLDKDFSKGGGPFANATSTLPDMWNRGFSSPRDAVDAFSRDPLRPVLKAPGRMYMVLAARRLAALVAMIRDYHPDETVSLVAHSQGCMLSLLAQAFLMQQGDRPADTLVLTHPPYSLVDDIPALNDGVAMFSAGEDAAMVGRYDHIGGLQTMMARLSTLANIVQGVAKAKHGTPAVADLKDPKYHGMVGLKWEPTQDRDNRGKVYLYFSPEDMTVALKNIQGIGWQGVPDLVVGTGWVSGYGRPKPVLTDQLQRLALKTLGESFFQRVFTARLRIPPGGKAPQPVLVGAQPPYDFALRVTGEEDHAHVSAGSANQRAENPEVTSPPKKGRTGIRTITGEKLNTPVQADMYAGALTLPGQPRGAHESVDPIDAAISVTSDYGLMIFPPQTIEDPRPVAQRLHQRPGDPLLPRENEQIAALLNHGKERSDAFTIAEAHYMDGKQIRMRRRETPNEARLRQQRSTAPRSFHGAIFGSAKNHRQVTAYDIAIGGGKAVSDPKFYRYLCAVADWRLKKQADSRDKIRPGILTWDQFEARFAAYLDVEPKWRKDLIVGNCTYYSSGQLPIGLPVLPEGLPPTVVCETMTGERIEPPPVVPPPVKKADAALTMDERLAQNAATKSLDGTQPWTQT